jgi:hypothetical protein
MKPTAAQAELIATEVKPARGKKRELMPTPPAMPLAAPAEPAPLLFGIITADMLKDIDVDKMQHLLDMKLRIEAIEAEKQFNKALASFQGEMPAVYKWRAESKGKYNYASYDDIMRLARPILQKNGLSVSFSQSETTDTLTIVCRISHVGGHTLESPFAMPKDGPIKTSDGRNVTSLAQAQASSNTYAKRYCLCNALDIVVTSEDDDCEAGGGTSLFNEHEVSEVSTLLDKFGETRDNVLSGMLNWLRVESLTDIPSARFNEVMDKLRAKLKVEGKAK